MTTIKTATDPTKQRIAELNDLCRKAMGLAGRVFQTQGIAALPLPVQSAIREKVELFDSFTEENDPHGEHDFGAFEHEGARILSRFKRSHNRRSSQNSRRDSSRAPTHR
jgi:hypothetical protein